MLYSYLVPASMFFPIIVVDPLSGDVVMWINEWGEHNFPTSHEACALTNVDLVHIDDPMNGVDMLVGVKGTQELEKRFKHFFDVIDTIENPYILDFLTDMIAFYRIMEV